MAVFTRLWNHIEFPLQGTGASIIGQDVTLYFFSTGLEVPLLCRVTDDYHVINYNRWRGGGDIAGFQWQPFIRVIGMPQIGQQIDHASLGKAIDRHGSTEAFYRHTGIGIQGGQEKPR